MIPYGRHLIDDQDIKAVVEVLQSDWLTTGPRVGEFEEAFAETVGARHAVAVNNGTAALHTAIYALGIEPGDEVIVPPMTFAATANCIVYQDGIPVFVDVDPETLLIDPDQVEKKITSRTKAMIAVDYTGQPCDYDVLRQIAERHGIALLSDGCHALGAKYKDRAIGSVADMTVFSFHPVKHITTGEGGLVTTSDVNWAKRMRIFRNHGITSDHRQRERQSSWFYEMVDLGYNYRMTDFQCALGTSQLKKLSEWIKRRNEIAAIYDKMISEIRCLKPLCLRPDVQSASEYIQRENQSQGNSASTKSKSNHAYHLYVVRIAADSGRERAKVFAALRNAGIGVNVHYIPVHLHPYYQKRFGTEIGMCPVAESAYEELLSLPMYPGLSNEDVHTVVSALREALE